MSEVTQPDMSGENTGAEYISTKVSTNLGESAVSTMNADCLDLESPRQTTVQDGTRGGGGGEQDNFGASMRMPMM